MSKELIQEHINDAFTKCEQIKDKLALLNARYNATVAYLNNLCETTGMSATVEVQS